MWCIYSMDYHSATKKDEALTKAMTWMNRENITASDRSQSQKTTHYMTLYGNCPGQTNPQRQKVDQGHQGWDGWEWGGGGSGSGDSSGAQGLFQGDGNILKLMMVMVSYTPLGMYYKPWTCTL